MADVEGTVVDSCPMPVEINTRERLGAGIYNVRIADSKIVDIEPRDGGPARRTLSIEYRVTDSDLSNVPTWDRIWLGKEGDPLGLDPNTWHAAFSGGKKFQRILDAAGVANSGNGTQNALALKDRQLMIKIVERAGKGEYEGEVFTNIREWFPLGTKDITRPAEAAAQAAPTLPQVAPASVPMPQGRVANGSFE